MRLFGRSVALFVLSSTLLLTGCSYRMMKNAMNDIDKENMLVKETIEDLSIAVRPFSDDEMNTLTADKKETKQHLTHVRLRSKSNEKYIVVCNLSDDSLASHREVKHLCVEAIGTPMRVGTTTWMKASGYFSLLGILAIHPAAILVAIPVIFFAAALSPITWVIGAATGYQAGKAREEAEKTIDDLFVYEGRRRMKVAPYRQSDYVIVSKDDHDELSFTVSRKEGGSIGTVTLKI